MKRTERDKARTLRAQGKSVQVIAKELGVAKSSVSLWVRNITLSKDQLTQLSLQGRSVESIEKRRMNRIANTQIRHAAVRNVAKKAIPNLSTHELLLVGAALYWGEGSKVSKGMAGISNSDPNIIKIMVRFFKEICNVDPKKLRGHIHTFSHLNAKVAEKYWSEVSGIPLDQFYKTYSKPSIASKNKKDSLPYGTLAIYVCNTTLRLTILGWIERLAELAE